MFTLNRIWMLFIILFFSAYLYSNGTTLLSDDIIRKQNLVDIQSIDATIKVQLMYATSNNFLRRDVYGNLKKCYLHKEVADKLAMAQRLLKKKYPDYALLIYDGLRPRRIQYAMWNIVKGTQKQQYVADPGKGSIHNYGAAVDLTIADENGNPLGMGTPFDYFGLKAQPRYENIFLHPELLGKSNLENVIRKKIEDELKKEGPLTSSEVKNRLLLREVMTQAGFEQLIIEWWHFNAFSNEEVRKRYSIIE
jgi:zinc D-Ala-D-Ala dipeptidase